MRGGQFSSRNNPDGLCSMSGSHRRTMVWEVGYLPGRWLLDVFLVSQETQHVR